MKSSPSVPESTVFVIWLNWFRMAPEICGPVEDVGAYGASCREPLTDWPASAHGVSSDQTGYPAKCRRASSIILSNGPAFRSAPAIHHARAGKAFAGRVFAIAAGVFLDEPAHALSHEGEEFF